MCASPESPYPSRRNFSYTEEASEGPHGDSLLFSCDPPPTRNINTLFERIYNVTHEILASLACYAVVDISGQLIFPVFKGQVEYETPQVGPKRRLVILVSGYGRCCSRVEIRGYIV